ncbi:hypothetical protein SAMN05421640_0542 [Ekhidna lutea]|uniref:Replication-associated protein G2P N-terminal domain-containing protein n=1 Tax=Ekhidna lutea TaxID=447679 RepID=A0A239F8K6_EKHLU|nr:phage/plasmid replication protein [Ekhidna lutea]SNS53081.1 hypothetical protein SAMN05421640_0542 [Ekhidna lutea]
MVDTIHLWLSEEAVGNYNPTAILPLLEHGAEHKRNSIVSFSGSIQNLKVSLLKEGVSVKGSLPKYLFSDNIQTLSRSSLEQSCEKLSDELKMPFSKATISRLDIAQTFLMNHAPETYFNCLGESKYFERLTQPSSLYYQNTQKQIVFYNKIKEIQKKGIKVPSVWLNQNTLRYEYRITKRVSKSLKWAHSNFDDLFTEKNYMDLIDTYLMQYDAIKKNRSVTFNLEHMNSPKDFHNQILSMAYNQLGDEAFQMIKELKHRKAFKNKEYYSRLKKEIRNLTTSKCSEESELIKELDLKVLSLKNNYR